MGSRAQENADAGAGATQERPGLFSGERAARAGLMLARRKRRDKIFAVAGAASVALTLGWIVTLFVVLGFRAAPALTATELGVELELAPERIPEDPRRAPWREILREGLAELAASAGANDEGSASAELDQLLSGGAIPLLREEVAGDPSLIGGRHLFRLPVADPLDQYAKGLLEPEAGGLLAPELASLFDQLEAAGAVEQRFAAALFLRADSRFPALAGIAGAATGSLLAIFVCFLVAFPLGVGAAIWFEEFAPPGARTGFLRVNVYNLAAVPSIIFGLLGLSVFLNLLGLPRGSPLVGGLVLALMTLPIVIVVSGAALQAAPPALRDAALALGASRQEAMLHHTLPWALPGVLTGTIIGLARAFGETAPLLLIGMNAFLPDIPSGFADPATALPAQVFIWADQPERGFAARTSAAILALLAILLCVNLTAIIARHRYEKKRGA